MSDHDIECISPAEALKRLREGSRLIDVRADHEFAASVVLHMAGPRHFDAGVDDRGFDVLPEKDREPLGIVDAVLQRQHDRLRRQAAGERLAGVFGVAGFHANENEIGPIDRNRVGCRAGGNAVAERRRIEQQAVGVDGLDMRPAADEQNVMPGAREQAAEIAADCACAENRDPHVRPFAISARRRSARR